MAFAEQFIYRILRHFGISRGDVECVSDVCSAIAARQRDARPEAEQIQESRTRAADCIDNNGCYRSWLKKSWLKNSKNDWRTDRISDPDLPRAGSSARRSWRYRSGTPVHVIRHHGSALIGYPCS